MAWLLNAEEVLPGVGCRACSRFLPQVWRSLESIRLHRGSGRSEGCVVRPIVHAPGCLAEARRLLCRALEGFGGGRAGVQHRNRAGALHGEGQYLSHGSCQCERSERTRDWRRWISKVGVDGGRVCILSGRQESQPVEGEERCSTAWDSAEAERWRVSEPHREEGGEISERWRRAVGWCWQWWYYYWDGNGW